MMDDQKRLEQWATHEAGHALVGYLTGHKVCMIEIPPQGDLNPHCRLYYAPKRSDAPEKRIQANFAANLAGSEAEDLLLGRHDDEAKKVDEKYAKDQARIVSSFWYRATNGLSDDRLEIHREPGRKQAQQILADHWRHLEALRDALIERRRIECPETFEILAKVCAEE